MFVLIILKIKEMWLKLSQGKVKLGNTQLNILKSASKR